MENISEAIKGRERLRYRNLWSQQVKRTIRGSSISVNDRLSPVWMCFYHSCSKKNKLISSRPSSGVLPWIYFLFTQILNFCLWNLKRLFLWLERRSKEKLLCDLREFSKVSGTVFMESLQTFPTLRMPQADFFFFRQNWNDLVYRSQRNGNKRLDPSAMIFSDVIVTVSRNLPAMTLSCNTWALKQTVRFYTTGPKTTTGR